MQTGEIIGNLAKEKGINLRQLSIKADVPYNTLYAIVKRKSSRVDMETLLKIAKVLGVHLRDLADSSMWEEFDKQHPEAGKEAAEFKDFIQFLKSIGYMVKTVPESDTYWVKLSKDGTTTTFSQEAFENFQLETKKSVDYQVWQKGQEKK